MPESFYSTDSNLAKPATMSEVPRLQLRGITKRYPLVLANDAIDLTVMPGRIHAILGENGAGKSTLVKIIYGAVQPDAGQIEFDGQPQQFSSPAQARARGIAMVFQHFSLFDSLTVAENVALGLDRQRSVAQVAEQIDDVAKRYSLPIDPRRVVHDLSVGERQRVEILRALLTSPKLLILDEPTSVLTPQAVQGLFATVRQLADEGCSVLYISHKLDEIRELCNDCTVLRGGKRVADVNPREYTSQQLAELMIGTVPKPLKHELSVPKQVVLKVADLSVAPKDQFATGLKAVSLEVRAGEILGIAGVSGNGQQALLAALSGETLLDASHVLEFEGKNIATWGPRERRRAGIHFVPEERLGRGALPSMSLANNNLLTRSDHGLLSRRLGIDWLRASAASQLAESIIQRFGVKASGTAALAASLSGGNLQKYLMGREISAQPKLLLVAQPTWGVDVGAAALIRQSLLDLRDAGAAILVVSEELEELFEISDRLQVISQGRMSPSIPTRDATIEQIGRWMSGDWAQDTPRDTPQDTPQDTQKAAH